MAQKTMKAIKVLGTNDAEIQDVPIPEPQSHEVLVKVSAVAINPIDWKLHLAMMPIPTATLGCDFTGTIAAVGSSIAKPWNIGDRVLGWVVGNNSARKENGAFAEYCVADAELCIRVPEGMSEEAAASPAAGITTAGWGVFVGHGIALPDGGKGGDEGKGETILVYGGTSATGSIAIQLAHLAGLNVLTTCSARNIPHVKALGASEAWDYKDPSCGEKINTHTKDSLTKIFDTISTGSSVPICTAAMGSAGGKVSTTLPWPEDRERKDEIQAEMLFTLGTFGVPVGYGEQILPANAKDYEYAKRLNTLAEKWLAEGKLKAHPPQLVGKEPGLDGVYEAMEIARKGGGSGVKLVVKL